MPLDPDASWAGRRPRVTIAAVIAAMAAALACGGPPEPLPEITVLPAGSQIVTAIPWSPGASAMPPLTLHVFDPVSGQESAWNVALPTRDSYPAEFFADASGVTISHVVATDGCVVDHVDPSGAVSGSGFYSPEPRADWISPEPILASDGGGWVVTQQEQESCTVRIYAPDTKVPVLVPQAFEDPKAFTWSADRRSVLFGSLCDLSLGCFDPAAPPEPRLPEGTVVDECLYTAPIDGGPALERWRYDSWGAMHGVIERIVPSPTGDRAVVFIGDVSTSKPYVVDLGHGVVTPLTVPMPTTGLYWANHEGIVDVAWSPDGTEIALLSDHEAPCDSVGRMSVACQDAVYVVRSDGSGLRRLGERWLYASQIAWR